MPKTSTSLPSLNTDQMQGSMRSLSESTRQFNAELAKSNALGSKFGSAFGAAFDGLVFKGNSLKDTVSSLGLTMSRLAVKSAFQPLTSGLGNVAANLVPAITKLFTGGGSLAAPQSMGNIGAPSETAFSASDSAGSWATQVNFNVTATDTDSFRRSESQIAAMLARTVGSGQRNL